MLPKTAKAHKLSRRMKFRGLDISIETDKGEKRHWHDPHSGEKGSTSMWHPYGYIRRTEGVDGDHVDVYVGPNEDAKNVYIINQRKKTPGSTRKHWKHFDEQKCMLGFDNASEARKAYLRHYNDDRFFGSMTTMPFEQFKTKVLGTLHNPQRLKAAEASMSDHLKYAQHIGATAAALFFKEALDKIAYSSAARTTLRSIQKLMGGGQQSQALKLMEQAAQSGQLTPQIMQNSRLLQKVQQYGQQVGGVAGQQQAIDQVLKGYLKDPAIRGVRRAATPAGSAATPIQQQGQRLTQTGTTAPMQGPLTPQQQTLRQGALQQGTSPDAARQLALRRTGVGGGGAAQGGGGGGATPGVGTPAGGAQNWRQSPWTVAGAGAGAAALGLGGYHALKQPDYKYMQGVY